MQIREYDPSNQKEVIQLWTDCNLVRPWNDPAEDIKRKLKVDPDLFLVAVSADQVIGSVMGGYEGHRAWINYLAVLPSEQGKGYGKDLLNMIETRLKEKGAPKINLQIRASNRKIVRFYESAGFETEDVISMGKRLTGEQS